MTEYGVDKAIFAAGNVYAPTAEPTWNEFHKQWYVWGMRWIKSKKRFSTVEALHALGPHFEVIT